MSMTLEAKHEVERFLRNGEKIGAIKYLRDTYGFSLEQSKILVEAMEGSLDPALGNVYPDSRKVALNEHEQSHATALLESGKKMEAVKYAKEKLRIPLREAKEIVDELERSVNPQHHSAPMAYGPGRIFLLMFGAVGGLFLGIAGYIFYSQNQSIEKSDLISGQVIDMKVNGDGLAAPVIAYEWNGQKWLHASSTYSSPPAYEVNEEVPIYVNRHDPEDIVVDTFSDRWFLISLFGFMGFLFTGIPVLVARFTRRR